MRETVFDKAIPLTLQFILSIFVERTGAVGSALDFGRGVPGSIPVRGVVCCGLEQVTFPQFNIYSVPLFLNTCSLNKSSTKLMLVVEI